MERLAGLVVMGISGAALVAMAMCSEMARFATCTRAQETAFSAI
jgi:hypothetical protein